MARFWHADARGIVVAVRVQPRARRNGVLDVTSDAMGRARLRIAVTAPPEDGRANKAVCEVLARAIGVPPSHVVVLTGAASREKLLHVAGAPDGLATSMQALHEGAESPSKNAIRTAAMLHEY